MTERNRCGSCTLCCKIVGVAELAKRPNTWCEHCEVGVGCRIYETRPGSCAAFECFWFSNDWMPDWVRPDRSKVVLEGMQEANAVMAMVDPGRPDAWEREPMYSFLALLVQRFGMAVLVVGGPPPREPVAALLPEGRSYDDLLAGVLRTAEANIGRYAEQEGISFDEALRQVATIRGTGTWQY